MSVDAGDEFVLKLLAGTRAVSSDETTGVRSLWMAERWGDETLTAFLVRVGVFAKTAARTADMIRKGYVQFEDARGLFAEKGGERLRELLAPPPPAVVESVVKAPAAVLRSSSRDDLPSDLGKSARQVPPAPATVPAGSALLNTMPSPPKSESLPAGTTSSLQAVPPSRNGASRRPSGRVSASNGRGEPVPTAFDLVAGMTLGKCLLTEQVGHGASGVVFRALHTKLGIPVAVKVLQFDESQDAASLFEQFRAEARLLAQLSHPNVVRVLDFEDDSEPVYLVLEYVEGLSLSELIEQCGRVRTDRAVKIIAQVCDGLNAARKLGVVHRDVKPANILLSRDGTAKLADLGLAVVVGGHPSGVGLSADSMAGTAAYMAPEQVMASSSVDFRADIYALGATFFHAVTGQLPFRGRSRMEVMLKHTQEPPPRPVDLVPDLDPHVSAVILRMMAKDPARRFASYEELIAELSRPPSAQGAPPGPEKSDTKALGSSGTGSSARKSRWRDLFTFGKKSES